MKRVEWVERDGTVSDTGTVVRSTEGRATGLLIDWDKRGRKWSLQADYWQKVGRLRFTGERA